MTMSIVTALAILFNVVGVIAGVPERNVGRIVGGKLADIRDIPYQLSLQIQGEHHCGASILSETWAVTAAHCVVLDWQETSKGYHVEDWKPFYLSLRAGSNRHDVGGTLHRVARIIRHEQYDPEELDYDIAVLKVRDPFPLGRNVSAIKLPPRNWHIATGARANVSGWGQTRAVNPDTSFRARYKIWTMRKLRTQVNPLLRKVNVAIVSRGVCTDIYPPFSPRMLCAGRYPQGGKDACSGDSGGPLVSRGRLVGVVSWGIGCGRGEYPGVYARISELRDWILNKTSSR